MDPNLHRGRPDRRGAPRCRPGKPVSCRVLTPGRDRNVVVVSLSQDGLLLASPQPVQVRTVLHLSLWNSPHLFAREAQARVARCLLVGHKAYHLGCEFLHPLSRAELGFLLA